jgi:hypothetical protein
MHKLLNKGLENDVNEGEGEAKFFVGLVIGMG